MPTKLGAQSFVQNWQKTVNWAKSQNIPYSAYYPVYQMDAQRFISGTQMSESDRIAAIEAAANLNYSTALPTDPNGSWTDIRGNTIRNAQDIFVGLEPTHLISNIADTIGSTFSHPGNVLSAFGDLFTGNTQAAANQILKPNNILQLVPGVWDIAKVMQVDPHLSGGKGGEALAQDPLTALLDVIPFGRFGSEALGRAASAAGKEEDIASRLGLATSDLRKLGIWRVGGKLVKTLPAPTALLTKIDHPFLEYTPDADTGMRTATGVNQDLTLGQLWDYYKQKISASPEQADIVKERYKENAEGTREVEEVWLKPAFDAMSRFKDPAEYAAFNQWVHISEAAFRPLEEVMADENVPIAWRQSWEAIHDWGQQSKQIRMLAGQVVEEPTPWKYPDGKPVVESYGVDSEQYRNVHRDRLRAEGDLDRFRTAQRPLTQTLFKMDENDHNMVGVFEVLKALREQLPNLSTADPQIIRNLLGLKPSEKLSQHMINALNDLFNDGGLLDQMYQAYQDQDWNKLLTSSRAAVRKFKGKSLSSIPREGRALLHRTYRITQNLAKYASERDRLTQKAIKLATDRRPGSITALSVRAFRSNQQWLKTAINNPPDLWRNFNNDYTTKKIILEEKTAEAMRGTKKTLQEQGWSDSEWASLHSNPRNMLEIMTNDNIATNENAMLPDIDRGESVKVQQDAYEYYASLRARGHSPLYIPDVSVHDIEAGDPTYNIYLRGIKSPRLSGSFNKVWGYVPSVYDVRLGMLKATKELVEKEHLDHFINQELFSKLIPADDIQRTVRTYYKSEINALNVAAAEGAPLSETALTVISNGIRRLGYEPFDPEKLFGAGFTHPSLDQPYYISSDLMRTFKQTIDQWQFPAQGVMDRGTQLFRFSILGLSPRYTAHIVFGGTFLLALRGNPGMLKFLGDAWHFGLHNSFSEKTLQRFPNIDELRESGVTNEGLAIARYHYVAANSAGRNWLIPEWLARHGLNDEYKSRVRAAAEINMRFTRAVVRMQKAVTYLDAAAKADKMSTINVSEFVPREPMSQGATVDVNGNPIFHPVTGRRIHDLKAVEKPMSKELAHHIGMDSTAKVMGDLRHMTPLERGIFQRFFPFYGWTKHILQYVMSYPFDHPWRAMILSQLAMQNTEDTASGLPLRIGLLTFLGQPDQYGNVTAIDTKSLDPLRDTANYASMTGLFESLNPAITGVGSLIDPQFSFAGQNLYPNVTYSQLYGVKTATAGGNWYNVLEQFVPQSTAIDEAFNISGQYSYLAKNGQAFDRKLFESLGLPLMPEQLNLRQIAAQGELDRHSIAANAAYEAATTGDLSYIQGYPANAQLPDPLNTEYNITPAYIKAMTQESENKYGLPFYETTMAPRSLPLGR